MLGLIYDVHGNLEALEAVLADAGEAGVGRFLLGGDYALFGPRPVETVERLRSLDARMIRGNGERWCEHPHEAPDDQVVQGAIEECVAQLGDRRVAELGALPEWLADEGVRFCHGSPISDVRSFMPEPGEDDEELLGGHTDPLVVFGHTHLPFERQGPGGIRLVNPGSVGMPFDGDPRASWAILHERDGRVEHRRVEYDHAAAAAAVRALGGRWSEIVARRIEQARFVT